MESYTFNMENMLRSEMDAMDDAMFQLQEKHERIDQLEKTIQKLKEKNETLEVANDKLSGKVEDEEAQIVGFRGQCIYLHQNLMKYMPRPTKEEAPPVVKGKESTPKKAGTDHKEQEVCQPTIREVLWRRAMKHPLALK
jgi:TolA-binding protein